MKTKDSSKINRNTNSNLKKELYIINREEKLGMNIILRKNRKASKAQARDFIIQSFALLALTITLSLQFYLGAWRDLLFAPFFGALFGMVFIIIFLSLLIYPKFNLNYINKYFMKFGHFVFQIINTLLLSIFYILTLPFALFLGRSKLLKIRPELTSWVKGGPTPQSTWRSGEYLNDLEGLSKHKGFIRSLFYTFMRERNIFILIMLVLVLIISMIILFAQSSAVAPFIYTIF
mgnify:CR=1 FL=1